MSEAALKNLHEDHLTLIALARDAFKAKDSAMWKLNTDEAFEVHSAACNALWDELQRQCAVYADLAPVNIPLSPAKQMIEIRKEAFRRLKERLPDLIAEVLEP